MNPVCPYCRTEIGTGEGEGLDCPGCGTPHHADCFAENGGCTVFGCSKAPVDEPKISLTGTEISTGGQAPIAPAQGLPAAAPPPPAVIPPPMVEGAVAAPPPAPVRSIYGQPSLAEMYNADRPKSRVAFVLFGVFLGFFGAHNFYAGYVKKGVAQLCVTLFTCFYGAPVSWIWAIIEICIINKDMDGVQFT